MILGLEYNCANPVAEECGIEKWWEEPQMISDAREKGLIP